MFKAAAYARYSSDNQREESIEAQLRAIKEYCNRNNMQIVKIYTDEARVPQRMTGLVFFK
jgi:site-specific DNA recombinase